MSNLSNTISFFSGQREGAIQMGESIINDLNKIMVSLESGEVDDESWDKLLEFENDLKDTIAELKNKQ